MKRVTKEEYIETIYALQKDGKAQTGQIAKELDVRPPSVTEMLVKLQGEGLVEYKPYLGAGLTAKGQRLARNLLQRHRAIAEFLIILGIDRVQAEKDACLIEHQMSPESAARLKQFVEFVQSEPKGKWMERFRERCGD